MPSYATKLDLPIYDDLLSELNNIIDWNPHGQICLNAPQGQTDDHQCGAGSLYYDWDKGQRVWNDAAGTYNWNIPVRENPLNEWDFTETVDIFRGTQFEDMLLMLTNSGYKLGRVRIMKLAPKTCLSWHKDDSTRLHYPFKTHSGCKMIIADQVHDLTQDSWWHTDTLHHHTAINASTEPRLHVVACVL